MRMPFVQHASASIRVLLLLLLVSEFCSVDSLRWRNRQPINLRSTIRTALPSSSIVTDQRTVEESTVIMDLNPTRSPGDEKDYRLVTLSCGLECMLISTRAKCERRGDLEYSKAAAAMSVQVGSFADPAVAEGCAHFLEHMVFMGSGKYPVENHYDSFVTAHGGSCNAFTEAEYTVYQFDINNAYFAEGLDIFAQCFISPLLAAGAVEREINAIDSEFDLAKNNDGSRIQQLMSHLCRSGHPLNKFSWGNLDSLSTVPNQHGVDSLQVVTEFHRQHYLPQNMKLVVLAPKPLEELQADVERCFGGWNIDGKSAADVTATAAVASPMVTSGMKKRKTGDDGHVAKKKSSAAVALKPLPDILSDWRGMSPFEEMMLRSIKRIIPVRSMHKLQLTWALPPFSTQYKSKPCSYIAHLLGHEGPGSLLSALKAKNYAASVSAGVSGSNFDDNSLCTLFEVSVALTEHGLANWMDVAWQVHCYLRMLRAVGPQRWVYEELKNLGDIYYKFLDEEEESEFVEGIAMELLPLMQRERHHILPAAYLTWDYEPALIAQILNTHLTERKASVTIVSSAFQVDMPAGEAQDLSNEADDGDDDDDEHSEKDGTEMSTEDEGSSDVDEDNDDGSDGDDDEADDDGDDAAHDGDADIDADNNGEVAAQLTAADLIKMYKGPQEWQELVLPPLTPVEEEEEVIAAAASNLRLRRNELRTEPHFGTSYWLSELPTALLEFWESDENRMFLSEAAVSMHLPPKNSFIPEDLSMMSEKESSERMDAVAGPETDSTAAEAAATIGSSSDLIKPVHTPVADGIELWYAADETFQCPKAEVYARIVSPVAMTDAWSAAMLDLSCRVLKDHLNEMLYMASMADLHCEVSVNDAGFVLKVSGYSDKACLLLQTVILSVLGGDSSDQNALDSSVGSNGMLNANDNQPQSGLLQRPFLSEDKFLDATISRELDQLLKRYNNINLKASQTADNARICALKPSKFSFGERAVALQSSKSPITADMVRAFMRRFRGQHSVELLVYGNVEQEAAVRMARAVHTHCSDPPAAFPVQPIVVVPKQRGVVLHQSPLNPQEKNVCVELYYQLHGWNVLDATKLDLLEQLISEPFFDQLRTKQQLGYSVSCGLRQTFGTLGFCFKVVSSSFSIEHVLQSILTFIDKIPKELLLDCGWQHYLNNANALIDNKLCRFRTMGEAAGHHWGVIEDRFYDHFDENEKQAALLKEMIAFVTDSTTAAATAAMSKGDETLQREIGGQGSELSPVALSEFANNMLLQEPRIMCVLSSVISDSSTSGGDADASVSALTVAVADVLKTRYPTSVLQTVKHARDVHELFAAD